VLKILKGILHIVDLTNDWVGRIMGYGILALIGVVVVATVARYMFHTPLVWAFDTTLFIFAIYGLLGAGYAVLHGTHIIVDVFHRYFPPKTKAVVDLCTSSITVFLCVVLIWFGTEVFIDAMSKGERVYSTFNPPLWPFRVFLPIGGVLLLLQVLAKFTRDFVVAVTGEKL